MIKRSVPLWLAVGAGLILVFDYFLNVPGLTSVAREIQSWVVLISAFLLGIGMINLLLINLRGIRNRKTDILDASVLTAAMVGMFVVTTFQAEMKPTFDWVFNQVYAPLGTAVFSLLMYSMASVAFRAIRIKSVESAAFLVAAVVAMLGVAPVGATISPSIPAFYDWLLKVVNMTAQRGVTIAAAVGAMAASLRVLLGIERRYIGME